MTRLKADQISNLPLGLAEYDTQLLNKIGLDLKSLALSVFGLQVAPFEPANYKVAVIPVTAGKGSIEGFSEALCAIATHLGFSALITSAADVGGLVEAYQRSADLILLADDNIFVAINLNSDYVAGNDLATALGFAFALDRAAEGVRDKQVLLIGAGVIGSKAAVSLCKLGAKLSIYDLDPQKELALAASLKKEFGYQPLIGLDLLEALQESRFIFDASDQGAFISEKMLSEGAIISTPGLPLSLDEKALLRHGERLIHDPLQIGTAVMLFQAVLGKTD